MAQLIIADELATDLSAKAAANNTTTDQLLRSMLFQWENDRAFVERTLTPEIKQRMLSDRQRLDRGEFLSESEIDAKFEGIFAKVHIR